MKRTVGAEQTLDGHGCRDVGGLGQAAQIFEGEQQHAEDAVGAVDQRESFLRPQHEWLAAERGERSSGGDLDAGRVMHRAFA